MLDGIWNLRSGTKAAMTPCHWRLRALLAIAGLTGCGGPPTGPSGISVQFVAAPSVGGSFSMSLDGRTYSSSSLQVVVLKAGTYEASGTAAGTNDFGTQLIVGFTGGGTAVSKGGVKSGSIVTVAGPGNVTTGCGIGYFVPNAGPYQFRFRFTVTDDPASAC